MMTNQEQAAQFAFLLPRNEQVVTVWKNGEWRVWGAMDAFYAQTDPDYLVTISLKELGQRDDGIHWILDGGEHCDDCEAMAAGGPYNAE